MKPAEIRELSDAQLVEKLKEMRAELFNLRFQMATSQLDNTARVNTVKKDIARVLTEQRAAVAGSQREGRLLPAVYRGAEPLAELPWDFRKALHGGFVDVDFPAYAAVVGAFIAGAPEFIVKLWSHHSFVTSK